MCKSLSYTHHTIITHSLHTHPTLIPHPSHTHCTFINHPAEHHYILITHHPPITSSRHNSPTLLAHSLHTHPTPITHSSHPAQSPYILIAQSSHAYHTLIAHSPISHSSHPPTHSSLNNRVEWFSTFFQFLRTFTFLRIRNIFRNSIPKNRQFASGKVFIFKKSQGP